MAGDVGSDQSYFGVFQVLGGDGIKANKLQELKDEINAALNDVLAGTTITSGVIVSNTSIERVQVDLVSGTGAAAGAGAKKKAAKKKAAKKKVASGAKKKARR